MSGVQSTAATGEGDASRFHDVFRAELAVVLPGVTLPAKSEDGDAELAVVPPGVPPPEEAEDEAAELAELSSIAEVLDRPDTEDLAALCLSGGGIRSASFGLGVLQSLARFGLLGQFHYLSTVSGGGYIGSWLSAWRYVEDDDTVFAELTAMQVKGREPSQIQSIRANSNFITPTLGVLSADTWTVVAVYVRNLILNWLLFVPLLTGILLFPRWYSAALVWARQGGGIFSSNVWLSAGCALLTIGLACAVCGRFRREDRWLTRKRFLWFVLAPIVLSAFCFTFSAALGGIHGALGWPTAAWGTELIYGAIAGAVIYLYAWLFGRVAAWLLGRAAARRLGRVAVRRWDDRILVPDLICWILSGALVGLLIALGLQLVLQHSHNARLVAILGLSGVVLAYLVGDIFYVGASSLSQRGDIDREWLARASGWLAAVAVSWGVVSALALYGPGPLHSAWWGRALGFGVGGVSGIVTLLLGPSALTAATRAKQAVERVPLTRIASIAAVIFAAAIGALLSILGRQLVRALGVRDPLTAAWADLPVIVALVGSSFLISLFVNVNRFSLHAMYRNRLVRAFLGSARGGGDRSPDPFTGFDKLDNPSLAEVAPKSGAHRLFHVINTTLNVVATRNTAWQERKAESFSMTRLHCGNRYVRYRPTREYGDRYGGITLGTAMAISGAALSPNQGYNSSSLVGFLLMLFNVRLGWWLGNPSREFYPREAPVWSITPALKELAGATTDTGRWIYLSDGGHFDNLGLYEMVRRRCRCIVVVDAGCDPEMKFEDLGNAVRKSYIDFGVNIDFRRIEIQARRNPPVAGARFGLAEISYPRNSQDGPTPRTGWLLYIKPTYYCTTEGMDVRGYASDHPTFPHESTTDQWFSESQLEAYRALGAHIMEQICAGGTGLSPGVVPKALSLTSLHSRARTILDQTRPQRIDPPAAGGACCGH